MKILPALFLGAVAFAAPVIAGVEPGNWEFTVDVSIAENNASTGPVVRTRCITEEEARDPQKVLAETGQSGCEFTDSQDTGSEYTFKVQCSGGRIPVHGSGHINYTAQTMKGVIDLVAEQPSLRITTHSSVSARRLGPCNS
jgi:hypothetical protein